MDDPGEAEEIFGELMTKSAEIMKWNRKHALDLLEKANEIEARAAVVANSYRGLAASLILEAQAYADDQADLLMAEFPLEGRDKENE